MLKKLIIGFMSLLALWIIAYCFDSIFGGYVMRPETIRRWDETKQRIRYEDVLIKWQPRFGSVTTVGPEGPGVLFQPLIYFDQKYVHVSISLRDENGLKKVQNLPARLVHP